MNIEIIEINLDAKVSARRKSVVRSVHVMDSKTGLATSVKISLL